MKQGESENFRTVEERDQHLQKQIGLQENGQNKLKDQIHELKQQVATFERSKLELQQVINFPAFCLCLREIAPNVSPDWPLQEKCKSIEIWSCLYFLKNSAAVVA